MHWNPNRPPTYSTSKSNPILPPLVNHSNSPLNVDQFLSQIQGLSTNFHSAPMQKTFYPLQYSLPASPMHFETPVFISHPTAFANEEQDLHVRQEQPMGHSPVLDIIIDTNLLHLYPTDIWTTGRLTAKEIVEHYFQRRSSKKMPFHYKLYNALQITAHHPELIPIFGCQWVTTNIFKIYRVPFARLLGVGSINGALFNKQGSLPTHGFISIPPQSLYGITPKLLEDVDNDSVRLFRHTSIYFHTNATEQDLTKCRWKNPRS